MAINRPVTKTLISTPDWGIPITDAVNAHSTDIAALKPTVWTPITLVNGWVATGGTPQYRKIGDNVQLRGGVGSGAVGSVIGTLPVGFRPVLDNHYIQTAATISGVWHHCIIYIGTDGAMNYHVYNVASTNGFISVVTMFSTLN